MPDFMWRFAGGPEYAPAMKLSGWGFTAVTRDCDGDFATLVIKAGGKELFYGADFRDDFEAMKFAEQFISELVPGLSERGSTSNAEEWR